MTDASATPRNTRPNVKEPPSHSGRLRSLGDILDALDQAADTGSASVGDVLEEIGMRSFAPLLLVPAMLLVSPLSGVPSVPTFGAILMLLITGQKLVGRPHIWLPGWLKRRNVRSERLSKAVSWLRRFADWIDSRTHKRLSALVSRPSNIVTLLVIVAICLVMPFLEVLPMVTSVFAVAISFYAIGLLARDGLFTLLGHAWVGVSVGLVVWLMT